ncbi:hypothetical protein EIN_451130, partial [Entamoeba invadens IP1]
LYILEPIYLANVAIYIDRFSSFETFQCVSKNCVTALEMLHINPPKLCVGMKYLVRVLPQLNTVFFSMENATNELKGDLINKVRWIDSTKETTRCEKIAPQFEDKIQKLRIFPYDIKNLAKYFYLNYLIIEQFNTIDLDKLKDVLSFKNITKVIVYIINENLEKKDINLIKTISSNSQACHLTVVAKDTPNYEDKNLRILQIDVNALRTRKIEINLNSSKEQNTDEQFNEDNLEVPFMIQEEMHFSFKMQRNDYDYKITQIEKIDVLETLFLSGSVSKIKVNVIGDVFDSEKFLKNFHHFANDFQTIMNKHSKNYHVSDNIFNMIGAPDLFQIDIDAFIEGKTLIFDINFIGNFKEKKSKKYDVQDDIIKTEQNNKNIEKLMEGFVLKNEIYKGEITLFVDLHVENCKADLSHKNVTFELKFGNFEKEKPKFVLRKGGLLTSNFYISKLSINNLVFKRVDIPSVNTYVFKGVKYEINNFDNKKECFVTCLSDCNYTERLKKNRHQ